MHKISTKYKANQYRKTKPGTNCKSLHGLIRLCLYRKLSERKRSVTLKSFDIDTKPEETIMADLTNQPGVTK